jgi:hypothetical protein
MYKRNGLIFHQLTLEGGKKRWQNLECLISEFVFSCSRKVGKMQPLQCNVLQQQELSSHDKQHHTSQRS